MAAAHPEPFHRRALHSSGRDLHYTPYKPQERLRSDSLFLFRDTAMSSQSNRQVLGSLAISFFTYFVCIFSVEYSAMQILFIVIADGSFGRAE
jgi:hypothetical protein